MNTLDETQFLCLTSPAPPPGRGVLLGIPSGGVPSGSPNPDRYPDQNI